MPRKNQYTSGPIIPGNERRPSPPAQLDARERAIWTKITARLPADWFTAETQPMLTELCRHIRNADDLTADLAVARAAIDEIQKQPEPDSEALEEAKKVARHSTKLRLTPQARYAPSTAKREAAKVLEGPEPWSDWGENRKQ
jgi:hypothetical protein